MRKGHTAIISNDGGHLKPDISRSPASPWGSFLGTWQTERKPIQLKTRTKLMAHLAVTDDASRHGSRASSAGSVESGSRESERAGETTGPSKPQSPTNGQKPDQNKPIINIDEPYPQGSKPPTPAPGSDPRLGRSTRSIQGSVPSPARSLVSSAEGPRLQSPLGSRLESSESQRVRSALVRSATSPPSPAGYSMRPRTASAESHSQASGTPPQRPESRMGGGESGVQSPLGARPPSSQFPLTTACSFSRGPTAGTTAGLQDKAAFESAPAPVEDRPARATLAQTETQLTTATLKEDFGTATV